MPSSPPKSEPTSKESSHPLENSSRSKKSSGKVKTNAVVKVKADVAAKIIVDAAIKANTADAAVNVNCPRNFKKYINDNFIAAKKTCKTHVVKLQRQMNAADHVKA